MKVMSGKDGWIFGHTHATSPWTFQHARWRQTVFCQQMNGSDHVEPIGEHEVDQMDAKKKKLGDSLAVTGAMGEFYLMLAAKFCKVNLQ